MSSTFLDRLGRPLGNLRLSVTDRCNLRCQYCMPEDEYVWLPRENLLNFEETSALVDVFLSLGVDKVRLTGGEPLLRRDLPALVQMLAGKPALKDLALTTNGVLLADQIDALAAAGLGRVTVSLDTLRRDRFTALTRFDQLEAVMSGIAAASKVFASRAPEPALLLPGDRHPQGHSASGGRAAATQAQQTALGARPLAPTLLKIDSVVIRGVNDDELTDLLEYGRSVNAEVRFIEYMDVGGATKWSQERVVSRREMLGALTERYGALELLETRLSPGAINASAPADRYVLNDGTTFGIISSTTEPFCRSCDRSRLTADGMWFVCLYATHGVDLRAPLRRGASVEELRDLISDRWKGREDRGAEMQLALGERRAFVQMQDVLRRDPHLEMHTRGG